MDISLDRKISRDLDLGMFKKEGNGYDETLLAKAYLDKLCKRLDPSKIEESKNIVRLYGLLLDKPSLNSKGELELEVIEFLDYEEPKFVWNGRKGPPPSPVVRCVDLGRKLQSFKDDILRDQHLKIGKNIAVYGKIGYPGETNSSGFTLDLHCLEYSDITSLIVRIYSPNVVLQGIYEE